MASRLSIPPFSQPRRAHPPRLSRTAALLRSSRAEVGAGATGKSRGQSLVEFAISLPFLLLILLGTIDMGQMFFEYIQLRNAVREGAAFGAQGENATDAAGIAFAVTRHGDIVGDGFTVVSSSVAGDTNHYGPATITVTASRVFRPLTTSFLQRFGLGDVNLSASSTAKVWT